MRLLVSLFSLLAVGSASAAFTPLGTSGNDPNNYGSFSGSELTAITLNGKTYTTAQMTQIELTAFVGAAAGVLLQQDGMAPNPTAQQRRDFLETDWRGDTGIINPSSASDSVAANFKTPVVNIDGPDMFVYEINTSGADPFQIRINGVQLTVNSGNYGNSGADTSNDDVLSLTGTPANLNQLLTLNASVTSSNISQNILGVGIDFSDFGVALGDTVSSFTFNSFGSNTFDPVIIAAVPEPQTYAQLIGALALGWVVARRRKQ